VPGDVENGKAVPEPAHPAPEAGVDKKTKKRKQKGKGNSAPAPLSVERESANINVGRTPAPSLPPMLPMFQPLSLPPPQASFPHCSPSPYGFSYGSPYPARHLIGLCGAGTQPSYGFHYGLPSNPACPPIGLYPGYYGQLSPYHYAPPPFPTSVNVNNFEKSQISNFNISNTT
jgi:hypothetical protein